MAACLKEAVGAIIVKNNKIISTGYNVTPVGTINFYSGGCQVCNNSEKISTEVLSAAASTLNITASSRQESLQLQELFCIRQVCCVYSFLSWPSRAGSARRSACVQSKQIHSQVQLTRV
jgi:deoxycytidylate deaminase